MKIHFRLKAKGPSGAISCTSVLWQQSCAIPIVFAHVKHSNDPISDFCFSSILGKNQKAKAEIFPSKKQWKKRDWFGMRDTDNSIAARWNCLSNYSGKARPGVQQSPHTCCMNALLCLGSDSHLWGVLWLCYVFVMFMNIKKKWRTSLEPSNKLQIGSGSF